MVQGDAGTGKTYAVSAIREYLSMQNESAQMVGLSFTGKAAQSLEEESGIASSTLHSYISQEEKRETNIKQQRLIIVDEAGMAGSLQISRLIEIAKKNDDKIVFIGDTKQFSSIAAGNIFLDMQKYGAKTIYMSETMRQKSDHAKGIVGAVKSRQIENAIKILEKRSSFVEMDQDEAIERIALVYSKKYELINPLNDELIIASRNADRIKINAKIRENLGKTGKGEVHTVKELVSQNGVGRYFTKGLKEGMIIIPSKVPMSKNGAEYRIREIIDERHIEIEAAGGQSVVIDFYQYSQQCQIYKEMKKEFAPGDTIIFTKNANITHYANVKNGERAVIKSIQNGIIETANGKKINLRDMNFVDYGYAITDFKSQGATTKNVTIFADAQMASMESFYTQVTRVKENIMIYTSNKEEMMANLTKAKKRQSTLAYTAKDMEVAAKIQTKRELADTFRGAGGNLTALQGKLENLAKRLGLPSKDNTI